MSIGIFSTAGELTGGNYRVFKVLSYFPTKDFILLLPINNKEKLYSMLNFIKPSEQETFRKLLLNVMWIRPFTPGIINYIKYAKYISKIIKKEKLELLYYPHEHVYLYLGFKLSGLKWTGLLQTTPVVGSLTVEEGRGFTLMKKDFRNKRLGYSKIFKGYLRLLIFNEAIRHVRLLAVSKSIPYELSLLGIRADIRTVDPGVGVDPCPLKKDSRREIDVIYYARIVPEKGIFDFLKAVRIVNKVVKDIKVAVLGMANNEMQKRVITYAKNIGLNNMQFLFNASKDQILDILTNSKIIIYPSRLDAFPLSLLEAISCGVVAIAYGIPAIRFNFDTPSVIKVKPGNVEELASKTLEVLMKERYTELSKIAVEFSSRFRWEEVAKSEWQQLIHID